MTPRILHQYITMEQIKQEREDERWRAIFDAEQRRADYRAGLIAAMVLNAQRTKESDKLFAPSDFFPYLTQKEDGSSVAAESGEMSTESTVRYLREGFGLFVPTEYKSFVGL